MVADTVWLAIASGGSAVTAAGVTAYINRLNTKDRIQEETDRQHGEFYLEKKVETLIDFLSALQLLEEINIYRKRAYASDLTMEEYEETVIPQVNDFHRAMARTRAFLTEEQYSRVNETYQPLRTACDHIVWSIENDIIDPDSWTGESVSWNEEELIETIDAAEGVIRSEIQTGLSAFEN